MMPSDELLKQAARIDRLIADPATAPEARRHLRNARANLKGHLKLLKKFPELEVPPARLSRAPRKPVS